MDKDSYSQLLQYTIKISDNKLYNIQAVAKMLGIPHDRPYPVQCRMIMAFLKKRAPRNKLIAELLESGRGNKSICAYLVKILYSLFSPKNLPNKAPILISPALYKSLLVKEKNKTILPSEKIILDEALNVKYCSCIRRLYLKNIFIENILEEEAKYNPYAICMSSIYKNRGIKPHKKVSYSCSKKYKWYRKYT